MSWRLIHADCVTAMTEMDEASVDAIVTDPPYGLEFMGKEWDRLTRNTMRAGSEADRAYREANDDINDPKSFLRDRPDIGGSLRFSAQMQQWQEAWATAALRVLKPGGHLLAFGGTRTYHRLACAVEDAGFEIRDCLAWMYGSGFPKSLDVSKAIDKAAGAEREVVGVKPDPRFAYGFEHSTKGEAAGHKYGRFNGTDGQEVGAITAPATPEAQRWQGWGTALKPAFEPIVLARKPLVGSVASNVQTYGTGALNIDGTRIGFTSEADEAESKGKNRHGDYGTEQGGNAVYGDYSMLPPRENYEAPGRWPANVVLDPEAAALLDEQTGERMSPKPYERDPNTKIATEGRIYGNGKGIPLWSAQGNYGDTGGASRFFRVIGREDNEAWSSDARTAEPSSTPSSEAAGSAPSGAPTSEHHAVTPDSPEPSTSATPSGSSGSVASGTPPIPSTAAESSPASPLGSTEDGDPARSAEHPTPTATTTTTPSPSTSATSAAVATSDTMLGRAEAGAADSLPRYLYCPKADREERDRGLEHRREQLGGTMDGGDIVSDGREAPKTGRVLMRNPHPTVKPVELMRWLCKLITPPGGTVLDPFTGSGSTGIAALREGFSFIGIEREAEYVEIARDRIIGDAPMFNVPAEVTA